MILLWGSSRPLASYGFDGLGPRPRSGACDQGPTRSCSQRASAQQMDDQGSANVLLASFDLLYSNGYCLWISGMTNTNGQLECRDLD